MKIYRVKSGILLESAGKYYLENSDWDEFVNVDDLFGKINELISNKTPTENGEELN